MLATRHNQLVGTSLTYVPNARAEALFLKPFHSDYKYCTSTVCTRTYILVVVDLRVGGSYESPYSTSSYPLLVYQVTAHQSNHKPLVTYLADYKYRTLQLYFIIRTLNFEPSR